MRLRHLFIEIIRSHAKMGRGTAGKWAERYWQVLAYLVLAVVGNKIDRCDEEQVEYEVAKDYANKIGALFKLVSAK